MSSDESPETYVLTMRRFTVVALMLFIIVFLGLALYSASVDESSHLATATVVGTSTWISPDGVHHVYVYGTLNDDNSQFVIDASAACASANGSLGIMTGSTMTVSLNHWGKPLQVVPGGC